MYFANKNIIVGVDPGTTVGIAILDTHGNLLLTASKKNAKLNDIVKLISNFGKPVLICTDRNPPPKYVKKLSSSFGSKIFLPEHHITSREKHKLVRGFSDEIKSSHQIDSLSAAVKAWKSYRFTFESRKFGGFLKWLRIRK